MTLLVGAAATGATVVVARSPADLADCDTAFVAAPHAAAALDACGGDVYAVSTLPLGGRLRDLPAMVLDAGAELPSYGDVPGHPPEAGAVELDGAAVVPGELGLGAGDRLATVLGPGDPHGLRGLLSALAAGSALVLLPGDPQPDALAALAAEQVTATLGLDLPGLRRL